MKKPVYMDYHATTPVDPRVLEAMLPFFSIQFGNAASRSHSFGWDADAAVTAARDEIASLIGASGREVIFTSGATEADNLALKGSFAALASKGDHIITSAIEHPAILDPLKYLEHNGAKVSYLPVDAGGLVSPESVERAITPRTVLVSIMAANNEIGTIQPIRSIGEITRAHGILFHTDAAQAAGRIPLNVEDDHIDLLSMSAHKIYGPKGIGALYVRRRNPRVKLEPQIHGGGHEQGLRSGTLPVPLIVGFATAMRLAVDEMETERIRLSVLRDRLKSQIMGSLDGVSVNGTLEQRLANNLNLSFAHVDSESVLVHMKDVALSSGSACSSATETSSHVIEALRVPDDRARSVIRFGLGRFTTEEEVDFVAERVVETVAQLRARSPHRRLTGGVREGAVSVGTSLPSGA
ncbi:MAG: aminotransferase class V-fold PLP-dependent enzyme [Candidatus Zixiibacteriota bacterium]